MSSISPPPCAPKLPSSISAPVRHGGVNSDPSGNGREAWWCRWRRGLLIGVYGGTTIVFLSIALLVRSTLSRLGDVSSDGTGYMWAYVLRAATPVVAFYLALGVAAGLAGVWISRRSTTVAYVSVSGAIWGILAIAAIPVSPASLAKVPVMRDLPFAVAFGAALSATIALAFLADVRWGRLLSVAAVAVVPLALPPLPVKLGPIPDAAKGSVLILGVDDVDRDALGGLAKELYSRDGISHGGFRLLTDAVSPIPVTRFAWRGILTGSTPMSLFGLDTLTSLGWRKYYEQAPFLLTRAASQLGYRSTYISDDATTNSFLAGEAFDEVREDAIGWQVEAHYRLRLAFPLYAGYIGRHTGVGIPGTPGSDRSLRLFAGIGRTLADARGPQLIAVHAVSLHGPLKPTIREMGGVLAFLAMHPRDIETLGIADGEARRRLPSNRLRQEHIYSMRRAQALGDVADFLTELDRAGGRRTSLVILFSDHGELFLGGPKTNAVGVHGTVLEPVSTQVAVLVLLPPGDGQEPLGIVRGTFSLADIAHVAREFMERSAQGHASSGLLDSIARGALLSRRMVAARSVGRPEFPGDLYGGRRTFPWTALRGQVHLLPKGRISLSGEALQAMLATTDIGYTDGRTLAACSPMADGSYLAERYDGRTRVEAVRLNAPTADGSGSEEVCLPTLSRMIEETIPGASSLATAGARAAGHTGSSYGN